MRNYWHTALEQEALKILTLRAGFSFLLFQKYFHADFDVILYVCETAGLDPILLMLKGTAARQI